MLLEKRKVFLMMPRIKLTLRLVGIIRKISVECQI